MDRAIEVVTELMWGGIEATERVGVHHFGCGTTTAT